jgi:hypothetical protein
VPWRAEAYEGTVAEVRDQNLTAGPDHGGEFVGDDLDGAGPGGGFDPLEQHA